MPATAPPAPFLLEDWRVDPALDRITRAGQSVKLDPRTMQVLQFLAARAGEPVTQEDIERHVWADVVVGPNSVYQAIAQLRRSLGDDKRQPQYIETIPRKGYRLIGRVSPVDAEAASKAEPATAARAESAPLDVPNVSPPPPAAATSTSPAARWWRVGLVALLIVAGIAYLLLPQSVRSRLDPTDPHQRSVAVLPLVDLSPEKSGDYLADGITEEILNSLAHMPELKVAARTSAFTFKGRNEDARAIGDTLGVRYVLEGSVRRVEKRIRVTAQLVDTRDGYQVWSKSYDRPFVDLLSIESDIAHEVANALRLVLSERSGERLTQAAAADIGAYEMFLIGQHAWQQRTPEALERALPYLQRAIDLDPKFAQAYAALALAHLSRYYYSGESLEDMRQRMEPLLERALELNPSLAEAHAARGLLQTELLQFAGAQKDLARAIQLNPNYANAHLWLGMALFYQGRPREALAHFERSADLDPLFFQHPNWIAGALCALGRYDEALVQHQKAQKLGNQHANTFWPLAVTELERGRPDLAALAWAEASERAPQATNFVIEAGFSELDLGHLELADQHFTLARNLLPEDGSSSLAPAWAMLARGDLKALKEHLALPVFTTSDDTWALADTAMLATFAGEPQLALERYQRVLATPSGETIVYRGVYASIWRRLHAVWLAAAYRDSGDEERAAQTARAALLEIERLRKAGVAWFGVDYLEAAARAVLDERRASLDALKVAVDKGWHRTWWARQDPAFRELRSDPQWQALIARADLARGAAARVSE